MLDKKLIENALALTWKSMEDMNEITYCTMVEKDSTFSIEKFSYYLLSKTFLMALNPYSSKLYYKSKAQEFWTAICDYQDGNEQLLIQLLSKIK